MWMSGMLSLIYGLPIWIGGWRDPFESEELNSFFVLTADIEPEPTIAKANLTLGLPFPSLVQPNPVPSPLCVRDGKSQRELTASKVGNYSPRELRRIRCIYDEISDLNQRSCTGTVANIIQQLGNIRRVALQVCRLDFHSI